MLVTPDTNCTNICFWYVPTWMRNQEKTKNWWQELGKVSDLRKCAGHSNDDIKPTMPVRRSRLKSKR